MAIIKKNFKLFTNDKKKFSPLRSYGFATKVQSHKVEKCYAFPLRPGDLVYRILRLAKINFCKKLLN